jgi:hypothetical protein
VPEIEPPPLTIDQEPPVGVPVNALVPVSHISVLDVVFEAAPNCLLTATITVSFVRDGHPLTD